ncbi:MAG: uracil-DNA glycosylase [Candidatus Thorarchaeota archaeon]
MNQVKELSCIHDEIEICTKCPLHKTRKNAVPGEGPANAQLMFVGEAPGAKEDDLGRPFVGRSGVLLTKALSEAGIKRDDVFITSILKSRPPKNRTPAKTEVEACRPYLERQIDVISPKVIVLLGSVAISSLIGPWKMSEAHGRFYEAANGQTFFMTYHPAAGLRFPKYKEALIADLHVLKSELV